MQDTTTEKNTVVFSLRMPPELHQWLSSRAGRNDRTMTAEMLRILRKMKADESTEIH